MLAINILQLEIYRSPLSTMKIFLMIVICKIILVKLLCNTHPRGRKYFFKKNLFPPPANTIIIRFSNTEPATPEALNKNLAVPAPECLWKQLRLWVLQFFLSTVDLPQAWGFTTFQTAPPAGCQVS